jgi:hypothetical protein
MDNLFPKIAAAAVGAIAGQQFTSKSKHGIGMLAGAVAGWFFVSQFVKPAAPTNNTMTTI